MAPTLEIVKTYVQESMDHQDDDIFDYRLCVGKRIAVLPDRDVRWKLGKIPKAPDPFAYMLVCQTSETAWYFGELKLLKTRLRCVYADDDPSAWVVRLLTIRYEIEVGRDITDHSALSWAASPTTYMRRKKP